jgi:hypothetical protein
LTINLNQLVYLLQRLLVSDLKRVRTDAREARKFNGAHLTQLIDILKLYNIANNKKSKASPVIPTTHIQNHQKKGKQQQKGGIAFNFG